MANVKKVKKKKLNIKGLILVFLFLYLIGMLLYSFFTMPIKNIYIKNTSVLTDNEVIEAAGIKNYPPIFKISTKKLEENIASLDLVTNVQVKKKLNGKLIITILEAKPLFYNRNTNKVVLSNHKKVESSDSYLGIPTLINYVPTDLLASFTDALKEIDSDIIAMINEIEYNPDISGEVVIDNNRFLLRMNDTNIVYVNAINMKRLNDYKEVLMTIGEQRGTLYLDSYNSENSLFTAFTEDKKAGDEDSNGKSED